MPISSATAADRPLWSRLLRAIPGAIAFLLWLATSWESPLSNSPADLGAAFGALAGALFLPLVIRAAYVYGIRRRTVPFWSPWIFVIGIVVNVLAAIGRARA